MTIYSGFPHKQWWFSVAILIHRRVAVPPNHAYFMGFSTQNRPALGVPSFINGHHHVWWISNLQLRIQHVEYATWINCVTTCLCRILSYQNMVVEFRNSSSDWSSIRDSWCHDGHGFPIDGWHWGIHDMFWHVLSMAQHFLTCFAAETNQMHEWRA